MTRQKILNALLIATFGAVAATAAAQTPTGQSDTPRNAPVGTAPEPAVGDTAPSPTYGGTMAPSGSTLQAPGTTMAPSASTLQAPATAIDTRLPNSSVSPKCQKLSGSALDDCLKGADTGQ